MKKRNWVSFSFNLPLSLVFQRSLKNNYRLAANRFRFSHTKSDTSKSSGGRKMLSENFISAGDVSHETMAYNNSGGGGGGGE